MLHGGGKEQIQPLTATLHSYRAARQGAQAGMSLVGVQTLLRQAGLLSFLGQVMVACRAEQMKWVWSQKSALKRCSQG